MINRLWSGLVMVFLLSGCGWNGTPTRVNDFTPLASIEIVAESPAIGVSRTIAANTSTKLRVNGNFSGLFTRDITDQAVWSSDTPSVAGFVTAANPNRVTGQGSGSAILTATVGSVSATFTLTVSPATVTAITVSPATPTFPKGLSTQFAASGAFSDATTQDLTFDATWDSSDPTVATVSDASSGKGFAQALSAGTTTVRATFGGRNGTTLMTVTEPVLQSITVSPANPSLLTLSTASFKAVGAYSDGTTPDITSQVAWTSSRPDIATIATSGAAKTLLQGTTSIGATLNGVSGSSTLKVTGGNLTSFTLSAANITLAKGTASRMTATGAFGNGVSRDITGAIEWSTANTTFATVTTPAGNLVFLNALAQTTKTTLTAKSGSLTATADLTVIDPGLKSIAISPASLDNLTAGTSNRFTLTATFNDNSTQDVTVGTAWSSSDSAKATAGDSGLAKGRITGVAAGAATISATYGGLTVTAPVTVFRRTLQVLTISPPPTLIAGNQVKCAVTANYTDGTTKEVTEETSWAIDNANVAILADSVNQPGEVVGVNTGTATLTANFGGKSPTVTITVP